MSIYVVGDIQGCFNELQALLAQVNFDPKKDQLWPAGDIVARGPKSLETLRFIKSLGDSAKMVLGNHDLHLLAIYAGIKKAKKSDLLEPLLNAPDLDELITWLAKQPLLRQIPGENTFMSHAGISPQWTIKQAIEQAEFAQQCLSSAKRNTWLKCMYGEQPNSWHDAHSAAEKFRFTINAFTRMRFCFPDKSLEFQQKSAPSTLTSELTPWYEDNPNLINNQWLFGHWASLMGNCSNNNAYALDTGCVWGNHLTLLKWSDKTVFKEFSQNID
ncbi:symmetrical bis(5'-nucleosyl)-tetraphosphatase [Thalassotalea sp. PLHSN55]|uniref:symmetrical bis(5'-nucleosyl)-tetraphosphatase n=1 Tax=Thalassotalea sp. PLHSN55 TaxID=3435888 RepID=UPI003F869D3A